LVERVQGWQKNSAGTPSWHSVRVSEGHTP
jgi:hypothetical protein